MQRRIHTPWEAGVRFVQTTDHHAVGLRFIDEYISIYLFSSILLAYVSSGFSIPRGSHD
jgi:hypothetical protein